MNQNVQAIARAHTKLAAAIQAYQATLARVTPASDPMESAGDALLAVMEIRDAADTLADRLQALIAPY